MASAIDSRLLGRSGLAVTELGFGAGPLGGFYGPVPVGDALAAVDAAWDGGIRYFDVAPLYGHGRAEALLGAALSVRPRDAFVISTKVGRFLRPAGGPDQPPRARVDGAPFNPTTDYSAEGIERSLEQSLLRLGLSHVDIVYIHDVDAHAQGSEAAAEQAFRAALAGALPRLRAWKASGTIRAIGVGINQPAWALRWLAEADLDVLMLAGRLTLLNAEALDGVLDLCAKRGVAYVAAGAYNGGLIASGSTSARGGEARFNYRPAPATTIARLAELESVALRLDVDVKSAALQFPLRQRGVASLVVGASSAAEVRANLVAYRAPMTEAFWTAWSPGQRST
jgi:D-threo-aldose 1-dehydrogenase